ncbi:PKD domain-containing protein [Ferruginibacter yonginensis]|uniref:PKD domain-containing protein n=1 Tax=Ferruginibacter yonginensis TaxID=1310416 RepID=A0ABV8QUC5_9BACT
MKKLLLVILSVLYFVTSDAQSIGYTGDTSFCVGGSKTLTALGTGATPIAWQYSPNGNAPWVTLSNANNFIATNAGAYRLADATITNFFDTVFLTQSPLPVAAFSFTPSTGCGRTTVQFTNTSSIPAPDSIISYQWNFDDGSQSTSANPSHQFFPPPAVASAQTYNVQLVVTSNNGCTDTIVHPVTIVSGPDATLGGSPMPTPFNGQLYFIQCNTTNQATLTFFNVSATAAVNSSYTIIWGDGTPNYTNNNSWPLGAAGQITHTYMVGLYNLTFIVGTPTGCVDTTVYKVFVGSNPTGSISSPGSTIGCTGNTFSFPFANIQNNPPGTEYLIFVNDGTDTVRYTQANVPAVFTHTFNQTSCGVPPSNTFAVSYLFRNPCGETPGFIGGIRISRKSRSIFSVSPSDTVCQNTIVNINSVGDLGSSVPNIGSGPCTNGKVLWKITPSTGWTIVSGTLGNDNGFPLNPDAWTSGALNLQVIFNTPGFYDVQLISGTTLCGFDSTTRRICVNPQPIANFNVNQSIGCAPLLVNTINTSNTVANCGANTFSWNVTYTPTAGCLPNTSNYVYLNGTSATSANPQFQFNNPGVYTISLITIAPRAACSSAVVVQQIIVKGKPQAAIASIPNTCANLTVVPTLTTSCYVTNATYDWTFTGGTPSMANTQNPGAVTFNNPGTYAINVAVTNECGVTNATQNVIIKPVPTVQPTDDKTYCAGAASGNINFTGTIPGTVFTWTNNNTTIGLGASGTGNIPSFTTTNNTTVPKVAMIIVTPTFNGCVGVKDTFYITVNPVPIINVIPNQSLCEGANTTAINFSGNIATAVYSWTNNNTAIGLAANGTGNIPSFTAINNTNAPIIATITVTATYNNAGLTCNGNTRTFTITVNPTPTLTQPNDISVCAGTNVVSTSFTATPIGTNFSWTNDNINIGLGTSGNGAIPAFTATNNTNAPITANIIVTPNYAGCVGNAQSFTITVNPSPVINFSAVNQTICSGTTTNAINISTATAGATISWVCNPPTGITGVITSGSNVIPTQTLINTTNAPITVNYIATATTSGNSICSGQSATYSIIVNPIANVASIVDKVYCNNANSGNINFSSTITGTTYNWVNDNTAIGLAASGVGNINNFLATNASSSPITANITVTPSFTNAGVTCTGNAQSFSITVNPSPNVVQPTNQVICNGALTSAILFSGSTNGTIYNWVNNQPSIGLPASGTGNIASFTAVNNGTIPVVASITVTPSYTNAGVTCTGTPRTFNITVNPTATVNQPAPVTICNGQTSSVINFSGTANTQYSWVNDNTSIGLAVGGSGAIPTFTAINNTNTVVTANITVTPTYTNAGVSCVGNSKTFTITVQPAVTVNAINNQQLCNGSATSAIVFSGNGVSNVTYSWVNSNTSIGLAASGLGNITSFTATNTTNVTQIATITVTPIANGCTGAAQSFTITVYPSPAAPLVTTPINYCAGATAVPLTATALNNHSLIWYANATGGLPLSTAPTPNTATVGIQTFYVSQINNTTQCESPRAAITVIVNNTPQINVVSSNPTSCIGSNGTITINGLTANTLYTVHYTFNNTPFNTNATANGSGQIIINNLIAGTYSNIYVTLSQCNSNIVSSITLNNPLPPTAPSISNNGPLCVGQTLQLTATASATPNVVYTWTGPNGFTSNLQNPTIANITNTMAGVYSLFITVNNCASTTVSTTVVVNTLPAKPTVVTPVQYCIGATAAPISATATNGGTLLYYTSATGGVGSTVAPTPPTNNITTINYYVSQVNSVGCEGPRDTIKVKINPNAVAQFVPTTTIKCPPFIITPAVIGLQTYPLNNSTYQWYANNIFIGSGATFPGYTISNPNDSVKIKLVALSLFGCKNDSITKTFYTYDLPQGGFTLSQNVGCGPLTVQFTNTTANINSFTYLWDFGNGQTSTSSNPGAVTFATNPTYFDTTYNVRLFVYANCDTQIITKPITVKSKPKALFVPSTTTGCSPVTITFQNNSLGIVNQYNWDFGDGTVLSSTNNNSVQHTYNTGIVDTFRVQLIAVNSCGADTVYYDVIINPTNINFNLIVNGPQLFGCAPHTVAFINSTIGANNFTWNFGDGNTLTTTSGIDTIYHTFNTPGNFTVSLTAANSCTDTTTTTLIQVFAKPIPAFVASTYNTCIGNSINFTNQSTNATSYLWEFGDGTTSTLANPTHTYTTGGNFVVRLTAYSTNAPGNICDAYTERTININSITNGSLSLSANNGTCAPFNVTFTNNTLPAVSAVWNFGDGTTGNGNVVSHTYNAPGIYPVVLNVLVAGGCTFTSTDTVRVTGPSGTLQYNSGYSCLNAVVQLQATASNFNNIVWNFGDGISISSPNQTVYHAYTQPGIYVPSITVQNSALCNFNVPGLDTIKVDKIVAGFKHQAQAQCGVAAVNFTDTSYAFFGKANVRWNFGDGTIGNGFTTSHTYAAAGQYNVEMIITGNSGCTDTIAKLITVSVNSAPIATIGGPATKCINETVSFTSNVASVDAIGVMQWQLSNGASAIGSSFSYTFINAGTYTLRLVAGTVNGCFDTTYHTIVINTAPQLFATNNFTLCRGNSAQLQVTGASNYQWSPVNGLSCINCANPVAAPLVSTAYVVSAANSFGCVGTDTVVVTVLQPFDIEVPPTQNICIGSTVPLNATGAATYSWSPAQSLNNASIANPIANPTVTTNYRVIGYDGNNCFTDTAYVLVRVGQYPTVQLGPDVTLATGTQLPLTTQITNGPITQWLWTPNANLSCNTCPLPIATVKKDITYVVKVTNNFGCSATDTLKVKVFCENAQVFIPNAFTPDGDGLNDVLMVRGKGITTVKYFRIFNRWGELIFERTNFPPNTISYGWDGKIKGIPASPEVFVYTAEVTCDNGASFIYKGNSAIIK